MSPYQPNKQKHILEVSVMMPSLKRVFKKQVGSTKSSILQPFRQINH